FIVDDKTWHCCCIQLDSPATVTRRLHQCVRHDGIGYGDFEQSTGLWIEHADFGQHIENIGLIDTTQLLERREVAPRQKIEIVDQRLHRRIEPILEAQLYRQTLPQITGKKACWIKGLHHSKNALDLDGFHAKILGQTDNIDTQIAALVQCI